MPKTLDILTKEELKVEYKLTDGYLRIHGRAMGGHGKPMIFDRELVELYLREQIWGERLEEEAKKAAAEDLKAFIEGKVRSIQSAATAKAVSGEMKGRGGKRKESAA